MLLLSREEIRRALPMADAIEAVSAAFAALSSGQAEVPPRPHLRIPPAEGSTLVMPAYLASRASATEGNGYAGGGADSGGALAVKVVSVFPHNSERYALPTISAVVLLLDPRTGVPLSLLEGDWLTALRTGAASGVATRSLARADARVLALFGAGAQALPQAWGVCAVRPIERIWLYAPTSAHAERLAGELRRFGSPIPPDVRVAASPREVLAEADVVCCATTSATPVFDDADLRPGTHVNGVGSFLPTMQEVPPTTVARARVVVDQRAAAWAEAGDLVVARATGLIDEGHVAAELGEVVLGRAPGRTDDAQITFFKSVGIAAQDAVVAEAAYRRARTLGLGAEVSLER
jgi:ornithine cyclodeaminase